MGEKIVKFEFCLKKSFNFEKMAVKPLKLKKCRKQPLNLSEQSENC